jgi:hypothetical protein
MALSKVQSNSIATNAVSASTIADGSITNTKIGSGAVTAAKLASDALSAPKVSRLDNTLRSSIQSTSGSYTDDLSTYVTAKTYAVILRVNYVHNGSSNHGYWTANFYQSGKNGDTKNIFYFDRAHFNWYYNNFWVEHILPWDSTGSSNLIVAVQTGYFTGDNRYSYGIAGILER